MQNRDLKEMEVENEINFINIRLAGQATGSCSQDKSANSCEPSRYFFDRVKHLS